ncbi:MAG: hypothetical protein EPO26_05575 [Chloroflexota bacterium]|nr:MAG: hypothetical protein EPO26_05575 [Chloroflexota bacterium]
MSRAARMPSRAGTRRAAILLTMLGGDSAAAILRDLPDDAIEAITAEIVRLDDVSEQERTAALTSCVSTANGSSNASVATDYARELLTRTLGAARAVAVVARLGRDEDGAFDFLSRVDPAAIGAFFENEHPQTATIALAHMPRELAGRVLSRLPIGAQVDIAQRLSRLSPVEPRFVERIVEAMRSSLAPAIEFAVRRTNGVEYLSRVLAVSDSETERVVMAAAETADPGLARELRERSFTFDDIGNLADRLVEKLARSVPLGDLAVALRGASPAMRDRFQANMSERARDALASEMARLGPARVRAIDDAQHKIVALARRLLGGDVTVSRFAQRDALV